MRALNPMADSPPLVRPQTIPAICVLSSCIALIMTATAIVLRHGYPTRVGGLVELAGWSLLIINLSSLSRQKSWYRSGFAFSLLALAVLTAAGLITSGVSTAVAMLGVALGGVLFLWNLYRVWRHYGGLRTIGILLLGCFLALHLEAFYWGAGQEHDLLYPEAIAAGAAHIDVAEQSAVVNMISTYRVPSTGIDGIVRLKYHNGAFWIAAAFRALSGMTAIAFVAYGFGIIVVPFYVAMFLEFADALRAMLHTTPIEFPALAWFVGATVLIGLVPFESNLVRANFNVLILNSDSFILGLALAFLVGGMVKVFYQKYAPDLCPPRLQQVTIAMAVPLLMALVGFVKISLMYSCLVLLSYLWLRLPRVRSWFLTTGLLVAGITMLWMMHQETGANKSSIRLFNFDRVPPEWMPYFFLIHFLWAWILVLVWMRRYGVQNLRDLQAAFRSERSIPLELVMVASVAGMLPYLVLFFDSGAWVYFTLSHALLAGAFIMALETPIAWRSLPQRVRNGSLPVMSVLVSGLLLLVAGHLFVGTFAWTHRLLKQNGTVRALLVGSDPAQWSANLRSAAPPVTDTHLGDRRRVLACLSEIGEKPSAERRAMALYIPKTNRSYWDLRQSDPGVTPFLAPAFSGVAMVEGLPEFEDIGYAQIGWGYPQYHLPKHSELPSEDFNSARAEASKDGFRKLVVFSGVSDAGCRMTQMDLD
jgi:hypothetical protein